MVCSRSRLVCVECLGNLQDDTSSRNWSTGGTTALCVCFGIVEFLVLSSSSLSKYMRHHDNHVDTA